ncbi:MAG: hypothetical protein CO003_01695 [Candidatus Portnoybacteria bacterium CG_4_8_14_3_um_filter_44_15]|uniref:Terminase large subunit gp17-like C-terminal domain-containing protein n=4 Tax=Candidatus Portnoyibacteriota TaxID=1817913 RepID=A0A2M7YLQ0_9BACT|nr:MAG: hypothetical protein CO003_01695 [Candidatus Portnoybacteria bacterium CG_4_8_14_3_um_filter_44_15]PJA63908.1 MAG: hypothetical protein CO160_01380 [Candidatus Portnoybacteria bacterium CG_4_9_14_3_um_filter_43_11]PJE59499.1 MAG: hypothetical protein COU84_00455 [Candidatus Portnoybacteria bacterium CG10_big_fil_rev_8_21_14_0_10_43_39]
MKSDDFFRNPTKGKMKLAKVAKEIFDFINYEPQGKCRLVVGTDSSGGKKTEFVTAIIVHRVGRGGRYFWKKTNGDRVYHTLRDRIYQEVNLSLGTAQNILGRLRPLIKKGIEPYNFQIHIDVGQNGPTKEMIKEVVGMVRGNGFEAKIKPESFAASNIADRHVR